MNDKTKKINSILKADNEMPFKTVKVNRAEFNNIFKKLSDIVSSTSLGWMPDTAIKSFIFSLMIGFHIFPISDEEELNKELSAIYYSNSCSEATFFIRKNDFIQHVDPARTEYGLLMVNEVYKLHNKDSMDDAMKIRLYHALSFYALLLFGINYSSEVEPEDTIGNDYYYNEFLHGMVDLKQYKDSLLDQLMSGKFN